MPDATKAGLVNRRAVVRVVDRREVDPPTVTGATAVAAREESTAGHDVAGLCCFLYLVVESTFVVIAWSALTSSARAPTLTPESIWIEVKGVAAVAVSRIRRLDSEPQRLTAWTTSAWVGS